MNENYESALPNDEEQLRQFLVASLAPVDQETASDAELEVMMEGVPDDPFTEEHLEFLLEKIQVQLREAHQGSPSSSRASMAEGDFDGTASPPSSPVLGFLGDLMKSDGWPNSVTFGGYLIAGLTAISLALAVAVLVLIVGFFSKSGPNELTRSSPPERPLAAPAVPETTKSLARADPSPVASLSRLHNVRWAGSEFVLAEGGRLLPDQEIKLDAGRAEIAFDVGVQMVVAGPAHLRILGPLKTQAFFGSITARVGKNARGFSILTPQGKVVDLGTEFGLNLSRSGEMQVAVFEGTVDIESSSPGGPMQRLLAGEGVRVGSAGRMDRLGSINDDTFPRLVRPAPVGPASPRVIAAVSDNIRLPESTKFYNIVHGGLAQDALAYVDRKHRWSGMTDAGLPEPLRGADYVKTFCTDKWRPGYRMTVQLACAADLYIFLDDRVPVPAWVSEQFEPTGWRIGMHEQPHAKKGPQLQPAVTVGGKAVHSTFSVWRRSVSAAESVTLGPSGTNSPERTKQLGSPRRQTTMYGIAAVAKPEASAADATK